MPSILFLLINKNKENNSKNIRIESGLKIVQKILDRKKKSICNVSFTIEAKV